MNPTTTGSARVGKSRGARRHLALEPLEPRLLLSVTILSEDFEGAFPAGNGWAIGDSNPAGTPAYWNAVDSAFGGEGTHGGSYKGYCAGTGFAGTTANPIYQDSMAAYMSRTIDLTGYATASLSFWFKIPSIESGVDGATVYIDTAPVWAVNGPVTVWTNSTITNNLTPYLGGTHTLKFEFASSPSNALEGWYLDDILLTGDDDPDDEIGQATSLGTVGASPISVTGQSISFDTDVDMYSFTVTAGQRVAFDIDRPSGSLNSYLRVFDSGGNQLAANDDRPGPWPEYQTVEACLEYTFATPGTYYIGVSGNGNPGYSALTGGVDLPDGMGAYDLTLFGLGPDPADTIGLATNLGTIPSSGLASLTNESLWGTTDVDMFAFTVAAGQRLGFDTDSQYGSMPDTYLRLFDATGAELAANDDAVGFAPELAGNDSYLEYTFNFAGTYYVGVSGDPNTGYDPLTGAGDVAGAQGWYNLTVRDLGRYVLQMTVGAGAVMYMYDCDLTLDIVPFDVEVVPGTGGAVSSITLVGTQQKTGLGIVVKGATSIGKVSDKRSLPGDMAFFISDAPVASLTLLSNVTGFNVNGLPASALGMAFPADIDLDGSTTDRTALYAGGTVSKLSLNGNLGADTVVQGDLPSVKITGSVAGDVCIGGSIPKPSVSGNWAGAIAANWIGSPKIGGTLSGSITTYSGGPNGVSIGKLTAGRIGNLVVNVSGGVSGIAAAAWADGSLRAAWLASLSVKGATGVPGDFGADLTLFGAPGITTLGKASIAGTLQDAAWSITGPVSGLTVGRWGAGSTMAVGVNPGPDLQYFTGDDQALVPAPAHGVGKLTIVAYDNAHAHDFGILAAYYWGSFKLGPLTQVPPVTDGQFRIVQVV